MRLDKKTRKTILLIGVAVLAIAIFSGFEMSVLSVDKIWLLQRGVGEAGEELSGGYWRVLATTQNTEIQTLDLDDESMKEHEDPTNPFPDDVQINGGIFVEVYQSYKPFWEIPVVRVAEIEVVPEIFATHLSGTQNSDLKKTTSVKCEIWKLDLSRKKVHIPFEVVAIKNKGENGGPMKTDDYKAVYVKDGTYKFDITQADCVGGTYPITFYNPKDTTEKFKITLQWVFGDYDTYSWDENMLFVVPPATVASPQPVFTSGLNTFSAYDENTLRKELDWKSGNDWTFAKYFYGGGNIFKGTSEIVMAWGAVHTSSDVILTDSYGRSKALIKNPYSTNIGQPPYASVAEGYKSDTTQVSDIHQYAGWYTPKDETTEWWKWRFPKQSFLYNSNPSTQPYGWSVMTYLHGNALAPVTETRHQSLSQPTIDVWGQGASLSIPNNLGVAMPTSSRTWVFTLDVSTELMDTIVVQESYINVKIQSFTVSKSVTDKIAVNDYATVTATLHNESPYAGVVSATIGCTDNIKLAATITGGEPSLWMDAGETKTVQWTITNNGNLDAQTTGLFGITIKNMENRLTDSRMFQLTFSPALGIEDTLIVVTVKDAETGSSLSGINARVEYGTESQTATTEKEGIVINIGKYHAQVTVKMTDPSGVYLPESKFLPEVHEGNNYVDFTMAKQEYDVPWWVWVVISIFAVAAIGFGTGYWTRRGRSKR